MMKIKHFFSRLGKRQMTVLSAVILVLVLALNLLLAFLSQKNAIYPDLTPETLYTVSDTMYDICDNLQDEVEIVFCRDPDRLLSASSTRYVYILAQQLSLRCPNIRVKTVDITRNPTAVYAYRTTSASVISDDSVILSCGGRYRIYKAESFYTVSSDGDSSRFWSFNGEYKLATGLLSVTAVSKPVAYFAYGHGESIYVSPDDTANQALLSLSDEDAHALYNLMLDEGLSVGYLNLDEAEKIPNDCVLFIMDGTKTDYTKQNPLSYYEKGALDKVHEYLSQRYGALMVFKDPTVSLPALCSLVSQWGADFRDVTVRESGQSGDTLSMYLNTDENQMSYGVYSDMAQMALPPYLVTESSGALSMSWKTDGQASSSTSSYTGFYSPFFSSASDAFAYDLQGCLADEASQSYTLASLSTRMYLDSANANEYYSYVFASASTGLSSNKYLTESSYGNYDAMFALVRYISRTDTYAVSSLGGTSLNSENLGGKQLQYSDITAEDTEVYDKKGSFVRICHGLTFHTSFIWMAVLALVPAVASLVVCIFLCVRRKNR